MAAEFVLFMKSIFFPIEWYVDILHAMNSIRNNLLADVPCWLGSVQIKIDPNLSGNNFRKLQVSGNTEATVKELLCFFTKQTILGDTDIKTASREEKRQEKFFDVCHYLIKLACSDHNLTQKDVQPLKSKNFLHKFLPKIVCLSD